MKYRPFLLFVVCSALASPAGAFAGDGLEQQVQALFDPNAAVDRIVEHRSLQMSLQAERAGVDMKLSMPNRGKPFPVRRNAMGTKPAAPKSAVPKAVPASPSVAKAPAKPGAAARAATR